MIDSDSGAITGLILLTYGATFPFFRPSDNTRRQHGTLLSPNKRLSRPLSPIVCPVQSIRNRCYENWIDFTESYQ